MTKLNPLERQTLLQLDGQNDREAILNRLGEAVRCRALLIQKDDETLEDPIQIQSFLQNNLDDCLKRLVKMALVVG